MSYLLHIHKAYYGMATNKQIPYPTFDMAQNTLFDLASDFRKNASGLIIMLDDGEDRYVCSSIDAQTYFKGYIEEMED